MRFKFHISFALLVFVAICWPSDANGQKRAGEKIPDFTAGDAVPKNANHDWNLGPTGARGWIYSNKLETTQARQILVTDVESKSPASDILAVGDVILGVNDKPFSYDPRKELGKAITLAEASDGQLKISRWRRGKTKNVVIQLQVLGSYSSTAPFNCPKSHRIFEQGCEALARKMQEQSQRNDNRIVRCINTMALLASGDPKYLPAVREQVKWASEFSDVEGRSLCCWYYGPVNMLLAEYTLATDDRTFQAELERVTMEIVRGQSAVGTWGHRFTRPDGRLNGYGMMNAPGLPMTTSLVLARMAGIENSDLENAIDQSVRLMRFYVGKGSVPYGDHAPWMKTHDDNGKNGIAAIMFNALGDGQAAEYFSRMCVASHGHDRELGHTGNFFNMLWAMPGVALSGPNASGEWIKEFGWYYDLARRWDGTFQHQGPAQPRTDSYKGWDATGAYLLAYGQSRRELYITGKQTGLVNQVDLKTAKSLVNDGRGFSNRLPNSIYSENSIEQLYDALCNWSPVVRERAASALSRRKNVNVERLIQLLQTNDIYSQLGACQSIAQLKGRAALAVDPLCQSLDEDDLWVRINAAQALAAIGKPARVAVPKMLSMLAKGPTELDPRAMEQRFLCFALFDRRNGLLNRSLDGIDRESLYDAVRAGLNNEDGRARGSITSVYRYLSYEEIEPLLPAIFEAVAELAPSGMMFADGIRISGLKILAKHKIAEALPLCIEMMELDRWGSDNRINGCLQALQEYSTAAKDLAPKLKPLRDHLNAKRNKNEKVKKQIELLGKTIESITSDSPPPKLRSLRSATAPSL